MPNFITLDGRSIAYGREGSYAIDDEQAFVMSLDKQIRAADFNNRNQVSAIQKNLNVISGMLQLGLIAEDGTVDNPTAEAIQYFQQNSDLFKEHGISQHLDAKKLEKLTNPAFTEAEHAPTMDEMKALEIDIGALYE
mgnify:CR=1 FL=1